MSDVMILNSYNKFMKIEELIDFEVPFDDRWNVFTASDELEDYCKRHEISYIKVSLQEYKIMAGIN
jgi:hypothetical protein